MQTSTTATRKKRVELRKEERLLLLMLKEWRKFVDKVVVNHRPGICGRYTLS